VSIQLVSAPEVWPATSWLLALVQLIYDRWIDKYRERRTSALANLKNQLEAKG
jgi:hypothetical protein